MQGHTRREVREVAAMAPQIERVSSKIATLERRSEWLEQRIKDPRNERTRSFDEAEHSALEAAIKALRYHRAALEPETDPVLALAEVLDAVDEQVAANDQIPSERVRQALTRARLVMKEVDAE